MRRSGKTTRLIDYAVQQLFEGSTLLFPYKKHLKKVNYYGTTALSFNLVNTEFTYIVDNIPKFSDIHQNKIYKLFLRRIENEHNMELINHKICKSEKGIIVALKDFKYKKLCNIQENYTEV